jgi:hypothetical protein
LAETSPQHEDEEQQSDETTVHTLSDVLIGRVLQPKSPMGGLVGANECPLAEVFDERVNQSVTVISLSTSERAHASDEVPYRFFADDVNHNCHGQQ